MIVYLTGRGMDGGGQQAFFFALCKRQTSRFCQGKGALAQLFVECNAIFIQNSNQRKR